MEPIKQHNSVYVRRPSEDLHRGAYGYRCYRDWSGLREQLTCEIMKLPATAIPATMTMAITKGNPYKRILNR
jgi:hypothetical protein